MKLVFCFIGFIVILALYMIYIRPINEKVLLENFDALSTARQDEDMIMSILLSSKQAKAQASASSSGSASASSSGLASASSSGSASASSSGSASASSSGSASASSSGLASVLVNSDFGKQYNQLSISGSSSDNPIANSSIINSASSLIASASASSLIASASASSLIASASASASAASSNTRSPLVVSQQQVLNNQISLVQPDNIKLYLNAFNIQSVDPKNTITVTYSFNNYITNDLNTFKSTGIESLLQSILNLDQNTVISTDLVNDTNNNTIVKINITYPQLSQSTAATTNLDSILQLPQNKQQILALFQNVTAYTIVGSVIQGSAGIVNNTYLCDVNSWCDYNNKTIKYNIIGDNIPTSINSTEGLGIFNLQLHGPPSYSLSLVSNNNILDSFTVVFYMKINSLNFNNAKSIIWYQMYAETPNMIRIAIYQQDANNSIVEVIIGNQNINYRWSIPNTTLMSNGYVTTYTFIYNKADSIFYFYIGATENYANIHVNNDLPIILGLTQIAINRGAQSLDAQLYAFLYYNSILSKYEIQQVSDYFNYQMGGIASLQLSTAQAMIQNQSLQVQAQNAQNLQTQLNNCANGSGSYAKSSVPSIGSNPWTVNYNQKVDPQMESELNKCSPLKLKELNLEKPAYASGSHKLNFTPISTNTKYFNDSIGAAGSSSVGAAGSSSVGAAYKNSFLNSLFN